MTFTINRLGLPPKLRRCLATEANFRRIDGYRDLWMLKAALDEEMPEGKEVRVA